ncbi:MAG: amidohydrolase family protein, partial [Caldisphaeraceae archaeon]|nr:amidohydrolase family protein [Caldisphaeraceae archaeon]MEB3797776.1 amidohydrolase family protein [Caldisphaeraceae archaeon]
SLREGGDFIKVMASGGVLSQRDRPENRGFTLKELKAIVDEASASGTFVHAHAEGKVGIVNSAEAGVKVIAHADMIDDEAIDKVLKANSIIVPTFAIDKVLIEKGSELGVPEWGLKKIEEIHSIHIENIKKAYKAGVKIATGTDFSGGIGKQGDNSIELSLLVKEIGMKPKEAIISATRTSAIATGMEKMIGTLEEGKVADLIAVEGNPLENIEILRDQKNIKLVVKGGEIYKNACF